MLVAYLDEVAEAGAFVSKTHKNYNGSQAFGYAGFVISSDHVRAMSQCFTEKKRRLFAHLIPIEATAGTWERKGSDIFTPVAWDSYRRPIEGFRELVRFLSARGGRLFFYGEEKPLGTATERWGKTLGFRSRDSLSLNGAVSIKLSIGSARTRSTTGKT